MIKKLNELNESEFAKIIGKTFHVYEKMDAVYFKVRIKDDDVKIMTSKGNPVTKIDAIVNSIYADIMDFISMIDIDKIKLAFDNISIGFFYFPKHKTKTIIYDSINEGTFMLSDYYVEDKSRRNDELLKTILGKEVLPPPYICDFKIDENFNRFENPEKLAKLVTEKTFSGNDISNIEGLIFRNGSHTYDLRIRDTFTNFDAIVKLLYRDTLLQSFVNSLSRECIERVLNSDKGYVEKICDLFLEYVNNTEFFNTMCFDADDFMPPIEGYIGDIDYKSLPGTVSLICRNNETYKNVLRILLVTFNNPIFSNKFKRFNDNDRAKLMEILVKINNKK